MFAMTIDGIAELEQKLEQGLDTLRTGVVMAVEHACAEGAEEARSKHAYQDQTGELTRSIESHMESDDAYAAGAVGVIHAHAKYASFVDGGTRPHEIHGRGGGMLAWEHPQGDWHRARVVHHPGTRPYGFMGLAYLKAQRVIEREVEIACEKVAASI